MKSVILPDDVLDFSRAAIYPGHPLVLSWIIVHAYPSFKEAARVQEPSGYPAALTSPNIPGAGGNVHAALDFLRRVAEGTPIDKAIARADDFWALCDGQRDGNTRLFARWQQGQNQAARVKETLVRKLETWR